MNNRKAGRAQSSSVRYGDLNKLQRCLFQVLRGSPGRINPCPLKNAIGRIGSPLAREIIWITPRTKRDLTRGIKAGRRMVPIALEHKHQNVILDIHKKQILDDYDEYATHHITLTNIIDSIKQQNENARYFLVLPTINETIIPELTKTPLYKSEELAIIAKWYGKWMLWHQKFETHLPVANVTKKFKPFWFDGWHRAIRQRGLSLGAYLGIRAHESDPVGENYFAALSLSISTNAEKMACIGPLIEVILHSLLSTATPQILDCDVPHSDALVNKALIFYAGPWSGSRRDLKPWFARDGGSHDSSDSKDALMKWLGLTPSTISATADQELTSAKALLMWQHEPKPKSSSGTFQKSRYFGDLQKSKNGPLWYSVRPWNISPSFLEAAFRQLGLPCLSIRLTDKKTRVYLPCVPGWPFLLALRAFCQDSSERKEYFTGLKSAVLYCRPDRGGDGTTYDLAIKCRTTATDENKKRRSLWAAYLGPGGEKCVQLENLTYCKLRLHEAYTQHPYQMFSDGAVDAPLVGIYATDDTLHLYWFSPKN